MRLVAEAIFEHISFLFCFIQYSVIRLFDTILPVSQVLGLPAQLFLQYKINGPNCSAYLFYKNPQSTYVYTLGIGIIANISLLPSYLLRGIRFNTNVNNISGSWFKGCCSDFILILKLKLSLNNNP